MKYEKQFEEFLKSDVFKGRIEIIMETIEGRFENRFLFDLKEVIEIVRKSFSNVTDTELSNIYSEEAISNLIEKNKIIKVKNSYMLISQFKKNYEFINIFNSLSNEEKSNLVSKILINKI